MARGTDSCGQSIFWLRGFSFQAVTIDPNVRKLKYLESGERYSAQGKYNEAIIQFSNALKGDKAYPEAHLGLARACVVFIVTAPPTASSSVQFSLAPSNCDARLELGSLLLAAGKIDAAQEQAAAVLGSGPVIPICTHSRQESTPIADRKTRPSRRSIVL